MTPEARRRHRAFLRDLEARGLTAAEEWLRSVGPVVGVPQAEIDEFSGVVRAIEATVDEFIVMLERDEEKLARDSENAEVTL